jgi:hypothetical protein
LRVDCAGGPIGFVRDFQRLIFAVDKPVERKKSLN